MIPAVTKRRKAKMREMMRETLRFLYCFALIDLSITSLRVLSLLLEQKRSLSTQVSILDCKITRSMIPPSMRNTKIELKRIV